jgi:hypothetical protein
MVDLGKACLIGICFAQILPCLLLNFSAWPVMAIKEKGAYIKDFSYKKLIYPQVPDAWNITVYNSMYEEDQNGAWFFFKFYVDGKLWLDEYTSTDYKAWFCAKGNATSRIYRVKGWNVLEPQRLEVRIELYRVNSNGNPEDIIRSYITILMILPLQHINVLSYLAAYLIISFAFLFIYYISGLVSE